MNIENKQFIRTINTNSPTKELIIDIKSNNYIKEKTLWLEDEAYLPIPRSENEHIYFIDQSIKVHLNDYYNPETNEVDNLGHMRFRKLEELAYNRFIMEDFSTLYGNVH